MVIFFLFNKWRERNARKQTERVFLTYFLNYSCPVKKSDTNGLMKMRIA